MIFTAFRNYRAPLLLAIAGSSIPIESLFAAPPAAPPLVKVSRSAKSPAKVVRAQSPQDAKATTDNSAATATSDATVRQTSSQDVPPAPNCVATSTPCVPSTIFPGIEPPVPMDPQNPNGAPTPMPPDTPQTRTGAYPMSPTVPGLSPDQGALSAQSAAPAFFGDFFGPGAIPVVVPGSLIQPPPGATPFAVNLAPTSGPPGFLLGPNDYFRLLTPTSGGVFATVNSNTVYAAQPGTMHVTNPGTPSGNLNLNVIPGTNPQIFFTTGYLQSQTPAGFNGLTSGLAAATPTGNTMVVGVADIQNSTIAPGHFIDSKNEIVANGGNADILVHNSNPILFALTNPGSLAVYSPSATAGGIQKIVDNASPIPRDRVFFNYNYFQNTPIQIDGHSLSVNRFTPGFEKTFFDQKMSLEVRVPFASTVDNFNLTPGFGNSSNVILGNQTTYLKTLLYTTPTFSLSAGLGLQAPTAGNTTYGVNGYSYNYQTNTVNSNTGQQTLLEVKNQAWHLLPYLGAVFTPNDRMWAQSVAQFDFATNGNAVNNAAQYPLVDANGNIRSALTPLASAGSLNDTNFMYLSANAGYWIYKVRNPNERGLTGFAPTIELDYNQSLQRSDVVAGYYGNSANVINNQSIVNGVIGANTVIGHDKYLSVAYVAPFTTGVNRVFDGELRVMFNYYFGAPRVNPRFSNVPGR